MSLFKGSVRLISATPGADRLVAAAARVCYSDQPLATLLSNLSAEETRRLVRHLISSGHLSPFEHVSFSFSVDGISRAASHQLVRHRLASFSQRSQRYCRETDLRCVVPPTIGECPGARRVFEDLVATAHRAYQELLDAGIHEEDARYVLPNAWETQLVMTMNAREVLHFLRMRLCRRAQWEIRAVAGEVLRLVREKAPIVFETAGPPCLVDGACHEARSCGRPFASMEELLSGEGD